MSIIETTDTEALNQISDLVSVANDTIDLPHSKIIQDIFLGAANLYIKKEVPDWNSLTGEQRIELDIITMKQTAVNILVAFFRATSESAEGLSHSRDQLTVKQTITRYEEDIIDGIKFLNPESENKGGRYISAAVVV